MICFDKRSTEQQKTVRKTNSQSCASTCISYKILRYRCRLLDLHSVSDLSFPVCVSISTGSVIFRVVLVFAVHAVRVVSCLPGVRAVFSGGRDRVVTSITTCCCYHCRWCCCCCFYCCYYYYCCLVLLFACVFTCLEITPFLWFQSLHILLLLLARFVYHG